MVRREFDGSEAMKTILPLPFPDPGPGDGLMINTLKEQPPRVGYVVDVWRILWTPDPEDEKSVRLRYLAKLLERHLPDEESALSTHQKYAEHFRRGGNIAGCW